MLDVSLSHGKTRRILKGINSALTKRRMVFVIGDNFNILQSRTDRGMNRQVAKIIRRIDDFDKVTSLLTDNVRLSAQNLLYLRGEGNDKQRASLFEYLRIHSSSTEHERRGEDYNPLIKEIAKFMDEEEEEYVADVNNKLPGYC